MSAHIVYDSVPLGSVIRYSDGAPKPPERFRKKLAAWGRRNSVGRLIRKEPPHERATYTSPACFTLHEGDFGEAGSTRPNCSCIVLKLWLHRVSRLSS